MGLDERLSIGRAGFDVTDPKDHAILANASQPPMGCSYVGGTDTSTTLTANVSTQILFNSTTTPVIVDPYHLIDTTAGTVKIPYIGVWEVHIQVRVSFGAGVTNAYIEFGPSVSINDGAQMCAGTIGGTNSCPIRMSDLFVLTREMLGTGYRGTTYYVSGLSSGGANSLAHLISFRMWLRSAVLPSQY